MKVETITPRPSVRIELEADEAEYLRKIVGNIEPFNDPMYLFASNLYDTLKEKGVQQRTDYATKTVLKFTTKN